METWREILSFARYAPSPHNVQPWQLRALSDTEADLLIVNRRTLPREDITGSFLLLSMGLFLEAAVITAASRGWELGYELHHPPEWYPPVFAVDSPVTHLPFARLRLHPRKQVTEDCAPTLLRQRRTSRVSLLPRAIPADADGILRTLAEKWGQRYTPITERARIERLLRANTRALFADLNTPDYHDEIVTWFRFTERQARSTRDGLSYRCMNTPQALFYLTARFPQMLRLSFLRPLLAWVYRRQMGCIPTLGMLSGPFWSPADSIQTGRFLMRFWLEVTRLGLSIHPFGNLVTNRIAADAVQQETGRGNIWLIFKIGYSPEPPASYRRTVEELLQ